jgi:hypothetical protein
MSSKKAKVGSPRLVDHPKEIQMPPYPFQQEFEGSRSVSFNGKDSKIDEGKERKLRKALQSFART